MAGSVSARARSSRGSLLRFAAIAAVAMVWTASVASPAWSETNEDRVQGPTVETLARGCSGCHGIDGVSPGAIPTIAGKSESFLIERMTDFRDHKRPSTIMGRVLKPFSKEDIAELAHYFASRKCARAK